MELYKLLGCIFSVVCNLAIGWGWRRDLRMLELEGTGRVLYFGLSPIERFFPIIVDCHPFFS